MFVTNRHTESNLDEGAVGMFVAHRHTELNLDEGAGDVLFANTESNLDEGAGGSRHDMDYSFHQKRGSISKAHHTA